MLNVTNTTVSKEAKVEVDNYVYVIIYTVSNNVITLISCSIRTNIDSVPTEVGNIRKENGQVNSYIRDNEDYTSHIMQFAEIVKEIEKEVESKVK